MDEHTSTSIHSYILVYGMSREPFGDEIEDDLFYAEPTRQQKLDILLHLAQYGNELMLVTGPDDSGKTTLLQQFKSHALDTWKVARIEAKNGIDERKLVQQLFHQMNLEFQGATHPELLEHLEHHFDSLQHSARQAVMLIDDAEHLPVTALNSILALSGLTSKDNKPLLRIILFGTDKLNENFLDPLLNQHNNIVRRNIELPAFDNEQTAHYILHRLSAADFSDGKPFTDSAMHKIHKQSKGWPGEINRLCHNLLVESAPTAALSTANKKTSAFNVPRAIAAAFGIAVISALLIFQDDFNHWLSGDSDITTDKNTDISLQLPAQTDLPAKNPTEISTIESNTAETSTADIEITETPTDTSTEITKTTVTPESTDDSIAKTQALPADKASAALTKVDASKQPADKTKSDPVAKDNTTANLDTSTVMTEPIIAAAPSNALPADLPGQRADWILKQNPEHYTLQLVAGNNIKTLRAFIQRHSPSEPLALYQSSRKNQPWFGLIHGTYSSKQKAFTARDRMSKSLRGQKPWVRKLGPLQDELRETTPAP